MFLFLKHGSSALSRRLFRQLLRYCRIHCRVSSVNCWRKPFVCQSLPQRRPDAAVGIVQRSAAPCRARPQVPRAASGAAHRIRSVRSAAALRSVGLAVRPCRYQTGAALPDFVSFLPALCPTARFKVSMQKAQFLLLYHSASFSAKPPGSLNLMFSYSDIGCQSQFRVLLGASVLVHSLRS